MASRTDVDLQSIAVPFENSVTRVLRKLASSSNKTLSRSGLMTDTSNYPGSVGRHLP